MTITSAHGFACFTIEMLTYYLLCHILSCNNAVSTRECHGKRFHPIPPYSHIAFPMSIPSPWPTSPSPPIPISTSLSSPSPSRTFHQHLVYKMFIVKLHNPHTHAIHIGIMSTFKVYKLELSHYAHHYPYNVPSTVYICWHLASHAGTEGDRWFLAVVGSVVQYPQYLGSSTKYRETGKYREYRRYLAARTT